jgi:hypothetical protein
VAAPDLLLQLVDALLEIAQSNGVGRPVHRGRRPGPEVAGADPEPAGAAAVVAVGPALAVGAALAAAEALALAEAVALATALPLGAGGAPPGCCATAIAATPKVIEIAPTHETSLFTATSALLESKTACGRPPAARSGDLDTGRRTSG